MDKKEITWRIRVYGIVQGVGFRPTVSRHGTANKIRGTVCNKGPYVEIYAQGTKEQVEGFLKDLEERPPKRAAILKINNCTGAYGSMTPTFGFPGATDGASLPPFALSNNRIGF